MDVMLKAEFEQYIDGEISLLTEKVNDDKHSANDEVSAGKLTFYLALRGFMTGQVSNEARGIIGAVNDTLQKLQLIDGRATLPTIVANLR
ncbi:hypothetical protein ACIPL1_06005 [Pseudomonas sp. NPDC090202]|uniref:hypothetical protein n=1 Tax=unclassified Pseudomonas TaxID=196821 RepID=UPI0038265509